MQEHDGVAESRKSLSLSERIGSTATPEIPEDILEGTVFPRDAPGDFSHVAISDARLPDIRAESLQLARSRLTRIDFTESCLTRLHATDVCLFELQLLERRDLGAVIFPRLFFA